MKLRKFGMACLNISQGRYAGYSHATVNAYDLSGMDTGIDRWRTWNDLEVIGVQPYVSTGFANTVYFYDSENDVTLAMTHCNSIPNGCTVGHVFHSGDTCYYEGMQAARGATKPTGNHIHLEIGKGRQTSKTKVNGTWQLRNFINIEDYFYIDETYTEIRDANGYIFSKSESEGKSMQFADGYQKISWNGNTMHVYKQTDKLDIGMMSADGGEKALQTIDKIDDDREHWCKINANYFVMTAGADHGQHLGVEQTPTLDLVPRQGNNYLALWIDLNSKPHFDYSSNYWLTRNDVKLACTPACIMLFDGKDEDIYSVGLGDKRNILNTQTMLLQCSDGKFAFAVTENKFNAYNCRNFAKDYGCIMCALMDSGGSTQMIVEGNKTVYTGRAIANVLTLFKKMESNDSNESDEIEALQSRIKTLETTIEAIKGEVTACYNAVSKL